MVRAKMFVKSIVGTQLRLECQYDEKSAEDSSFMLATPYGSATFGIDNPKALEQFKVGQSFYVDFTPAE